MILKSILAVFVVLFVISISPAYAQHHSGSLAPPIDLDGLQVAVSTTLFPEDFSYGDSKSTNLSIRFFDSETNVNIQSVTYRVKIFQDSNLVANEYFYDEDGKLDLKIKPTIGCSEKELWKCTVYNGEKHAIAGGYYARGDSIPTIQGPIFNKSGEYSVQVSIVGATNPKTLTTQDLLFETFLHLPEKQIFEIKTASAEEFPISVKS
ncbi:peptidase, partial [Nitrosopumilus sp.]|nr:peptidase [Nitrosopumilus sp.]